MILLFTSTVLAVILGASYAIVLANVGNAFPVSGSHSYLDSPYWLGLKRSNTTVLVGLQVLAVIGYIVWLVDLLSTPPTTGLLKSSWWQLVSMCTFLIPWAVWPYATYYALQNPSNTSIVLLPCACLWLASLGVILMIGGTFQNESANPRSLLGILLLGLVVVLVDGVGWSAVAIQQSLR
jgi:hypothetical protein